MTDATTPTGILGIRPIDVPTHALVVGDPARVEDAAAGLREVREIGRSREYVTVVGEHRGRTLAIASHGVGAAGAAICFEELARCGVSTVVRAGTCGGIATDVRDGDLVVGTAAVRDDGLTDRLVPAGWPAVADVALTIALTRAATRTTRATSGTATGTTTATTDQTASDLRTHVGIVHTAANFFPSPIGIEPGWRRSSEAGAVAIEMEFAALLVIASLAGQRAGGIFAVDGNLLTAAEDMADYDPHREVVTRAKDVMIAIALDVLAATP